MRAIRKVVIHHAAVDQSDIDKLISSMNITHKERLNQPADSNWSTCAYHWVIWVDGETRKVRLIEEVFFVG